jgi:mono/diheme cytochrome c family protein
MPVEERTGTLAFEEMLMFRKASVVAVALGLSVSSFASAQTAEQGKKVYADQKCSVCHSVAGTGNKKGPLDKVGTKLSADEIHSWIVDAPAMAAKTKADRKPPMKAYATLPKGDVDALVAYMQSLK